MPLNLSGKNCDCCQGLINATARSKLTELDGLNINTIFYNSSGKGISVLLTFLPTYLSIVSKYKALESFKLLIQGFDRKESRVCIILRL